MSGVRFIFRMVSLDEATFDDVKYIVLYKYLCGSFPLQWDLVCDRNYLMESSQTVFNGGIMFGALVFTSLSDMYGRKSIHLMCQWLLVVVGFATAFSPNFTFFAVFRFLGGALREVVTFSASRLHP